MLIWPKAVRVFLRTQPTDMRRSFGRLAQMVQELLHQDPFSGWKSACKRDPPRRRIGTHLRPTLHPSVTASRGLFLS
jgi:transposase